MGLTLKRARRAVEAARIHPSHTITGNALLPRKRASNAAPPGHPINHRRNTMKKSLLAAGVALTFAPLAAIASEPFTLGQIDVVAQARDMLSSAHVDQQTLELNNVKTVNEIAKFVPGVYTNRQGARSDNNIFVRGFGPSEVPLLVDGIPVYIPYDGTNDFGRYTVFDIATVDVSKGTGSVLYGPNALGGAVNLVTLKPTKPFEATVGAGFKTGKNSKTHGEDVYANLGTKQDLWYGALSLSYVNDAGMQSPHGYHGSKVHPMDGKRIPNSEHKDYKAQLKLGLTPNATDEYSLVISHQHGDKEQPLYGGDLTDGKHERWWRWPKWDKTNVYALSHTQLEEEHDIYLDGKVFYSAFTNDMKEWKAKGPFKTADEYADVFTDKNYSRKSKYRDHSYGIGFELGGTFFDEHALRLSTLWVTDVHKDQKISKKATDPQIKDSDRTITIGLEDTYSATDKLTLVGGVAYSHRSPKDTEFYFTNKKNPSENVVKHYDEKNLNAFDFQLKGIYQIEPDWDASIGLAKKTHFPSMKDRYSEKFGRSLPNPYLKAETAYHVDANTTKHWGDVAQAQVGVFYSQTHDAIEEVTTTKGKTMRDNVGKVRRYGVELAGYVKPVDSLKLGANYTYLHAKNVTFKNLNVTKVPEHKAFLWAEWQATPALSFYVDQQLQSKTYYDAESNDKLKAVAITNAKATYEINKNFTVNAGVSNIFDRENFYDEGYVEEGRTFFANLKYVY